MRRHAELINKKTRKLINGDDNVKKKKTKLNEKEKGKNHLQDQSIRKRETLQDPDDTVKKGRTEQSNKNIKKDNQKTCIIRQYGN